MGSQDRMSPPPGNKGHSPLHGLIFLHAVKGCLIDSRRQWLDHLEVGLDLALNRRIEDLNTLQQRPL